MVSALGAALGLFFAATVPPGGTLEPPLAQIYRGEARPLDLDSDRLIVRCRTSQRCAGFAGADEEPAGFEPWRLLTLATPLSGLAEAAQRADDLASDLDVEFAGPVFRVDERLWRAPTSDVLLRVKSAYVGAGQALIRQLLPDAEVLSRGVGSMPGAFRVRTELTSGFEVLELANRLSGDPRVEWAEPDWLQTVEPSLVPNDPDFAKHWSHRNVGQYGGAPGMDIDTELAWDITTGSPSVHVVILDNGVDQAHPDLNQLPGADFTPEPGIEGGPNSTCDHHGTAVAGVVSAAMNNGRGTVGVAPDSPIRSARFVKSTGGVVNNSCNHHIVSSSLVDALGWAAAEGARITVTSWSLGTNTQSQAIEDAYAATRAAGLVHFAAAGNGGDVDYPARLDSVVAVGGITQLGGPYGSVGPEISIAAPATYVSTTDRSGDDGYTTTDYLSGTGTSFAAPMAAGVAALLLSVDPSLSPHEVQATLQCSARELDVPTSGHGLVNAWRAVAFSGNQDGDGDGVKDLCDNCVGTANPTQQDTDSDGLGDACDSCPTDPLQDVDQDGLCAGHDVCPLHADPNQEDANGDGVGDACECVSPASEMHGPGGFDNVGYFLSKGGDLNGDGYGDVLVGVFFDSSAYAVSGYDGSVLFEYGGGPGGVGNRVSYLGDLDGDGYDDALLGGQADLFVFRGGPGPYPREIPASEADIVIPGVGQWGVTALGDPLGDGIPEIAGSNGNVLRVYDGETLELSFEISEGFPHALDNAGDVDGDGHDDLIVGSHVTFPGRAYIYSGATGALLHALVGAHPQDEFGFSVAGIGDVDGDLVPDVAVGAPNDDQADFEAGRVYLISGATGETIREISGNQRRGELGTSVSAAGDLDGDGVPDILAGAPRDSVPGVYSPGAAYAFSGQTGQVLRTWRGEQPGEYLGRGVAGNFDADGDGVPDVAAGAPYFTSSHTDQGRVTLFLTGDVDADGLVSRCDNCPLAPNLDQSDVDADGFGDACDCAILIPGSWAPRSTVSLHVAASESTAILSWLPSSFPGGDALQYDTLRTSSPHEFSSAECIDSDGTDTSSVDPDVPSEAGVYYYLVRAENDCGGTLGSNSSGLERPGSACP